MGWGMPHRAQHVQLQVSRCGPVARNDPRRREHVSPIDWTRRRRNALRQVTAVRWGYLTAPYRTQQQLMR